MRRPTVGMPDLRYIAANSDAVNVAEAMRLAWFTDMVAAMEANNIPWTLWECLDGGFGFVDMEYGIYRINCPLLKVLTGKELTDAEAKALLQKYGFKTE